ncbi:MAG: FAD-binding oxidoreductase [Pseudomonadota bacterium]
MDSAATTLATGAPVVVQQLVAELGDATVLTDPAVLETAATDVYRDGKTPAALVLPRTTAEIAAAVRLAAENKLSVYVRGGGMSYTDAFLPQSTESIIIDMSRMNAIREINATDLYATVDAGCTWEALDNALTEHGLRAAFWGPMSGRISTVGGAMAQGAVTFGSARNGPSVANILGLEVVLADGSQITTGSGGQPGFSPFLREYGPDLTGLLCNDAGAFGIKAAITVPLEPRPSHGTGMSFSFDDFDSLLEATRIVSRDKLATEIFGAETALVKSVAGAPNIKNDVRQLLTMMRAANGIGAALKTAYTAAVNGRRFLDRSKYLVNYLVEANSAQELKLVSARLRDAVCAHGVEVANTVAEFTRAMPFPDPAVLGPGGRRLLPLHGVIPYSQATALNRAYCGYIDEIRPACEKLGIEVFIVYATTGRNGFLYESVIYWSDEWLGSHHATLTDEQCAMMSEPTANPEARDMVEQIRLRSIEIFYEHGCTHYQIGRAYPYARDRDAGALRLLRAIRAELDPSNTINPGALGL